MEDGPADSKYHSLFKQIIENTVYVVHLTKEIFHAFAKWITMP